MKTIEEMREELRADGYEESEVSPICGGAILKETWFRRDGYPETFYYDFGGTYVLGDEDEEPDESDLIPDECVGCASGCAVADGLFCAVHPMGVPTIPCPDWQARK